MSERLNTLNRIVKEPLNLFFVGRFGTKKTTVRSDERQTYECHRCVSGSMYNSTMSNVHQITIARN